MVHGCVGELPIGNNHSSNKRWAEMLTFIFMYLTKLINDK